MSMPSSPELAQATRWQIARRIREVPATPEVLFSIIKYGVPRPVEILEGLPDDAELIETGFDPFSGFVVFMVVSAEFSPVPKGERIPRFEVTFRTVDE